MAEAADGGETVGGFPEEPVEERRFFPGLLTAVLPLAGYEVTVFTEKIQRRLGQGGAVQVPGEFQSVQHGPLPGHQVGGLPQGTAEMGLLQKRQQLFRGNRAAMGQDPLGIAPPQSWQRRTAGGLPLVDRVLQPQPHQLLVQRLLTAAVESGKQGVDGLRPVVFADGADDAVPIEVRSPLLVIGFEIRLKAVIPGGVPDQIPGAALLTVQNVHQANTSS